MSIFGDPFGFLAPNRDVEPATSVIKTKLTTQSAMVNSISLSSDMTKLYLIDNDRCIAFPLESKTGVIIGTLKGQLTAATALESPIGATGDAGSLPGTSTGGETTKLNLKGNQYTFFFNIPNQTLAVIGATDIDVGLSDGGGKNITPDLKFFSLKNNVLSVKRVGTALEITPVPARTNEV